MATPAPPVDLYRCAFDVPHGALKTTMPCAALVFARALEMHAATHGAAAEACGFSLVGEVSRG